MIHHISPRIEYLSDKKIVGYRLSMNFADLKMGELWKTFLPRIPEIHSKLSTDLISMVIYDASHFKSFKPTTNFERWAAVEVNELNSIPEGLESFILPKGYYAVFDYKGLSTDHHIFDFIFNEWLPHSDFLLDDRPHFEILGEKYKNNDPNSEEEIWIPIRKKMN